MSEDNLISLMDPNGKEFKCRYIATVDYNNNPYAILFPVGKVEGIPENSLVMFRMAQEPDGSVTLLPVSDEAEQEGVNKAYYEQLEGSCTGECGSCTSDCDSNGGEDTPDTDNQ